MQGELPRWESSTEKMSEVTAGSVETRGAWAATTLAKWREVDEFRTFVSL